MEMNNINEQIGARLMRLRNERGLSQQQLGDLVGKDATTVTRHESGQRAMKPEQMMAYAEALDVDAGVFLSDQPTMADAMKTNATFIDPSEIQTIPVIGTVQAGAWLEAIETDPQTQSYTTFAQDQAHIGVDAFALRVAGNSMDMVFPEGALLRCVSLGDYRKGSLVSRYVIVDRSKADGTVESTVKQLMQEGPDFVLQPRSMDPRHKPIRLANAQAQPMFNGGFTPFEDSERQDQIAIRAVVTGISHDI